MHDPEATHRAVLMYAGEQTAKSHVCQPGTYVRQEKQWQPSTDAARSRAPTGPGPTPESHRRRAEPC